MSVSSVSLPGFKDDDSDDEGEEDVDGLWKFAYDKPGINFASLIKRNN